MHDGRSGGKAEIKRCYVGVDGRRRIAEQKGKPFGPLLRGAAQRRADCFVSTATAPHASPYLARHGSRQGRQPPPILLPCAHSFSPAARRSLARDHARVTCARQALFVFLPSLLHPYAVNRCPIVDLG